ncbi:hypothetical protein NIBR502774_14310 (plasmid) [Rhizobium sp. NIBRBAC000502774]|nr:hypothetical protein NIBR502774_14310 [Rhizobium sp. NIBRBAC000502774]
MGVVIMALLGVVLQGCTGSPISNLVNNQRYETTSDVTPSWVGASEDSLVLSRVAPASSYMMNDGSKVINYENVWVANNSRPGEWGWVPDYARCEKRFFVENGVITRWYSSGDCPKRPKGAKLIPGSRPVPKPTM